MSAQPPACWPAGLLERIKAAERRIADNSAPRRIPADPHGDVDLVLAEVRYLIEGNWPPFWIDAAPTRAGTERHTRNEPDPESGIRISPGSSIPVERGMV